MGASPAISEDDVGIVAIDGFVDALQLFEGLGDLVGNRDALARRKLLAVADTAVGLERLLVANGIVGAHREKRVGAEKPRAQLVRGVHAIGARNPLEDENGLVEPRELYERLALDEKPPERRRRIGILLGETRRRLYRRLEVVLGERGAGGPHERLGGVGRIRRHLGVFGKEPTRLLPGAAVVGVLCKPKDGHRLRAGVGRFCGDAPDMLNGLFVKPLPVHAHRLEVVHPRLARRMLFRDFPERLLGLVEPVHAVQLAPAVLDILDANDVLDAGCGIRGGVLRKHRPVLGVRFFRLASGGQNVALLHDCARPFLVRGGGFLGP